MEKLKTKSLAPRLPFDCVVGTDFEDIKNPFSGETVNCPPDIQSWIMRYDAGSEQALVKQVPLTPDNISMIDRLADLLPLTRRYRGPRHNSMNMHRDCPKQDAERVSIYLKERVA